MRLCAIIPARFQSKRLPGKPLLKINNKELLLLTYDRIKKIVKEKDIYVFSDSQKVKRQLKKKIKNIILFNGKFKNGTERVSFGIKKIKKKYSAVIIISCDNPFINSESIKTCIRGFRLIEKNKKYCGSTVHVKNTKQSIFKSKSVAKIVLNQNNDILYISRSPIPYNLKMKKYFFTHHGPVCLKLEFIKKYISIKDTALQLSEDNEWLKFIERGYKIKSLLIKKMFPEVNTLADLRYYRKNFKKV